MSLSEIVDHWKQGAKDSLQVAELCIEAQKYEHALFNLHLATEKALKAVYIAEHDDAAPYHINLMKLRENYLQNGLMSSLNSCGR